MESYSEEYFWDFEGWQRIRSRVHIRMIHEAGKPFVVVCSQPLKGAGTSVQNAHEIIRKHLWPIVVMRLGLIEGKGKFPELYKIKSKLESSRSLGTAIATWILDKLSAFFDKDIYHEYRLHPDVDVVWIEHWPPETDQLMGPIDDYLIIRENRKGEKIWSRVNVNRFSKIIGYQPSILAKNEAIFRDDFDQIDLTHQS